MESSKRTKIKSLPENIIFEILSYLPVKERCIAGRVCKRWRQIIASNSLWRHVNLLEYRINLPKMWKILRAHFTSSLLSLRVCGYGLRNNYTKASMSDALLKDLQTRCPNINTFQLHDCNTTNLSLKCIPSSLTDLSITYSSWQPRWLEGGHSHLTNLKSLSLANCVRVDNFDLDDIAQWTNLQSLTLSGCYRIKGSSIEIIAKSCKTLEILDLSLTGVDELGIHHIARHCNNLKELYLQRCPNIRDSWFAEISSGVKNLQVLDVDACQSITVQGLQVLWSLKRLKVIKCSSKMFESDDKDFLRNGFIQNVSIN